MAVFLGILYVQLACFFLFFFFRSLTGSWYDVVLFFLVIFYALSIIIVGEAILISFLLTGGYLLIKQKYQIKQIKALSTCIELKIRRKESKNTAAQKALLWKQMNKIQTKNGQFYEEIVGQNRFWGKYLSLMFMFNIVESVFLSYSTIFDLKRQPFMQMVFIDNGTELLLSCLAATWGSSKLVRTNVTTTRELQRFATTNPWMLAGV